MSIDCGQLKRYVIIPTLSRLNLYSEAAVNLLLGTAAQESQLGTYLAQIGGPALGVYQTEPRTHDDLWDNFLKYNDNLKVRVEEIGRQDYLSIAGNLYYATAITRLIYLRVSESLPESNDIPGMAAYYKKYYNTPLGKATEQQFISNYEKFIR